jgi:hypothetical protein
MDAPFFFLVGLGSLRASSGENGPSGLGPTDINLGTIPRMNNR